MNDEIKGIKLDHFNSIKELKQNVETWIKEDDMYWERWFSLYDLKIVLDYITNLQEKYDKALTDLVQESHTRMELESKITNLQEELDRCVKANVILDDENAELQGKTTNLQEENERLKENAIHNDKVVDKAKWNEMIYKSRCEKAIELLNRHDIDTGDIYYKYNGRFVKSELKERIREILGGDEE